MSKHFAYAAMTAFLAATMLSLASGSAAADTDVVGKTYGEAKGVLGQAGLTPVVATVMGDRAASQDECYVTSTSKFTSRDSSGNPNSNVVQVNLNCYAGQSDTRTPGYSKGNLGPDAVAVRETHDAATKAWKATAEGQKWCAKFEGEHPEWAPVADCHPGQDDSAT